MADVILSNGKIVTVDDRFSIVEALAIKGQRIIAAGTVLDRDYLSIPADEILAIKPVLTNGRRRR